MASALAALANATLTFNVEGTGLVTDPDTGNVSAVQVPLTYSLYLSVERTEIDPYPGVNTVDTVYSGYAISPMAFDQRLRVGSRGVLTFSSESPRACEVLELRAP